jgi:hypothetical protein
MFREGLELLGSVFLDLGSVSQRLQGLCTECVGPTGTCA